MKIGICHTVIIIIIIVIIVNNGPVLFCSRASVVCHHLSSSGVVCNAAGGRAKAGPSEWAVGRPTLHGGCTTLYGYVPLGRHLVIIIIIIIIINVTDYCHCLDNYF